MLMQIPLVWFSLPCPNECCCTAPQIETPICTRRTASHQLLWRQQHTCGAVDGSSMARGVGGQPHKTPHFNSRYRYTHTRNDPPKSLGPTLSNPSTSPWTARPDGSGRWDNRMAAQHLTRDLVRPSSGFNNSTKRRRTIVHLGVYQNFPGVYHRDGGVQGCTRWVLFTNSYIVSHVMFFALAQCVVTFHRF